MPAVVLPGLALGLLGSGEPAGWMAVGLAAASCALLIASRRARVACLAACVIALCAAEGAVTREHALASPLESWFAGVAPDGRVDAPAQIAGVLQADAAVTDIGVRLVIAVDTVRFAGASPPIAGMLQ